MPANLDLHAAPISKRRRLVVVAALVVGAALWTLAGDDVSARRWIAVLVLVGLFLIPPVSRVAGWLLDRLRQPSPRTAEWTGVLVGVAAIAYLTATAFLQERPLAPRMFDECSYAISAQILAAGKLWQPPHPLADFFDTFFLVAKPVYSSIYFPGTGLALAPGVLVGWPSWIAPVVIAGIAVGLLYRIVTALTGDGGMGLLAALMLVALMPFRALSVMTMSHGVMLLLGLAILWAWLRWRQTKHWRWAIVVGVFSGWAAITRPVDALAYAIPVGIAMAVALRRESWRRLGATALALVLGAAPFLALQVTHNVGVTGDPLRTPYTDYLAREQPGAQFGIRTYDPTLKPASTSPQVQGYYNWCRPFLEQHQPHNFLKPWFAGREVRGMTVSPPHLVTLTSAALPAHALLALIPVGLIGLARDGRRRVVAASLPIFVLLYVLNPFFLPHYGVVVAPAMILLATLGIDVVARNLTIRRQTPTRVALVAAVLALSLTSLWEFQWLLSPGGRPMRDGFQEGAPQSALETAIDVMVTEPAVILFGPPPELWTEMVYNVDVAWPDDARIIRARNLGPRNGELIDYYGEHQPNRVIYRFDWENGGLSELGRAGTLREHIRNLKPPASAGDSPSPPGTPAR